MLITTVNMYVDSIFVTSLDIPMRITCVEFENFLTVFLIIHNCLIDFKNYYFFIKC